MSASPVYTDQINAAPPFLNVYDYHAPVRALLEDFVHARYAASYQANISHFQPYLLAAMEGLEVHAVLGLRPGACGTFFVEQYLDTSIEQLLTQRQGRVVARERIIETGNLAATRGGSQLLFIVLTQVLHAAGYRWITFTATPQVRALLQRLGFAPQTICEADGTRLGEQAALWGSYYDNKPSVLIGDIASAHLILQGNELAQKVLREHAAAIADIVATLQTLKGVQEHE